MSNENKYEIRVMTIDDYDEVYSLWQTIHGFGIRSIDDSREGVLRFLKRNPTTSVVAVEDGKIVERYSADTMAEEAACIMYAWMSITGSAASERAWWLPA